MAAAVGQTGVAAIAEPAGKAKRIAEMERTRPVGAEEVRIALIANGEGAGEVFRRNPRRRIGIRGVLRADKVAARQPAIEGQQSRSALSANNLINAGCGPSSPNET